MTFRVVVATLPLNLAADAVVLNVAAKEIYRGGRHIRFGGKVIWPLVSTLLLRHGTCRWISRKELIEIMYEDREDGGPLQASNMIPVLLHQNRGRLARIGLLIGGDHHFRRGGAAPCRIIDLWADQRLAA